MNGVVAIGLSIMAKMRLPDALQRCGGGLLDALGIGQGVCLFISPAFLERGELVLE
jgi:hypothetical protein